MTVNPNLSVYRVPFTTTVTGNAFVIAESESDALRIATRSVDIGDYIGASPDGDEVTIDGQQGEFLDTGPVTIGDDVKQVDVYPDYSVEDHPDYDPSEHDEPGDEPDTTTTDLPKPNEGLKS